MCYVKWVGGGTALKNQVIFNSLVPGRCSWYLSSVRHKVGTCLLWGRASTFSGLWVLRYVLYFTLNFIFIYWNFSLSPGWYYSRLWLYFSIQMLFTKECLWGCILLYSSIIFLYPVEILLHGETLYSAQDLLWTNLGFSSMIYKLGGCCCCCVCVYIYIWSFLVWHQSKQNLNPINHPSLTFTN